MKTILPRPKANLLPGYHPTMKAGARRRILRKVMKHEKPLSLGRHLLLLSTLTKRTIPRASKVYKSNSVWVFRLSNLVQKVKFKKKTG
jgi:hypothetical protein